MMSAEVKLPELIIVVQSIIMVICHVLDQDERFTGWVVDGLVHCLGSPSNILVSSLRIVASLSIKKSRF